MRHKTRLCTTLILTLSLTGCTLLLWGENPATSNYTVHHNNGTDHIHAFGRAQQNSKQIPQGSLVMMGERYWYIINLGDSNELFTVLSSGLSKPYIIQKRGGEAGSDTLRATLNEQAQRFTSDVCLSYHLDPSQAGTYQNEKITLENIGFTPDEADSNTYRQCYSTDGHYYVTPEQTIAAEYQFAQRIPVKLTTTETRTEANVDNIISNTLMTPATLALDAVGAVIILPLWLINGSGS